MSTIGSNPSIPGEGMLKWVKKQIDARQKIYGKKENRTLEEINYLNNRKPWIKLASSVRIKDKGLQKLSKAGLGSYGTGRNLAKSFVLFNGVTTQEGDKGLFGFRSGIGIGDETAYGIGGKDFGFKPMPAVESLTLSTKGNNGSLKEAIVKIKAYNKQQFDIIELLYLRLGYSVLLEFGNNLYVNNNGQVKTMGQTVADTAWFDNSLFDVPANEIASIRASERLAGRYQSRADELRAIDTDLLDTSQGQEITQNAQKFRDEAAKKADAAIQRNVIEANKLVLQTKKLYAGNYEGMIGKISNFNWELSADGVYDITLKIITYGDLIDGFYVNTKKVFPGDGEIGASTVAEFIGKAVDFFVDLFGGDTEPDPPEVPDIDTKFLKNAKDVTDINGILYMFYDALYNSKRGGSYANRSRFGGGNPWKYYTSNINKESFKLTKSSPADIFDIKVQGSEDDKLGFGYTDDKYISLGYYLDILNKFTIGYIEEGTENITGFNPKESSQNGPIQFDNRQDTFFCNTSTYQISADPLVCLVKNTGVPASILSDDQYRKFKKKKNGILVGDIMNIYLQMNFLAEICYNSAKNDEGKISVKQHVEEILVKVSAALGGLNRLTLKCDENTNMYYIFDENPIPGRGLITDFINPGANEKKPAEFLVYGFEGERGSFVRDYGIKSKLDGSLSTIITMGKSENGITPGYDATGFANWNTGLEDIVMPSFVVATQDSKTLSDIIAEYGKKVVNLVTLANKLYKNDEKVKVKYVEQTKNVLREVVQLEQSAYAANNKENGSSPLLGFIPISLDLTMDGLSGFKIFQSYTIPQGFLPSQYPDAFDFIIKKYSHTVNKDGWITKLESFSVPTTQEDSLVEPWYTMDPGKLTEIITEVEQEKADAEFESQQSLFDARSSVQGGGGGGAFFSGAVISLPGGGPQYDVDTVVNLAKAAGIHIRAENEVSLREFLEFAKSDPTITSSARLAYLFATFGAESSYNSSVYEAYYVCKTPPTIEDASNPCQKALNYYRSTKGGKQNYYTGDLDPRGFPYYGRGAIQLTWKYNYKTYGDLLGLDLVNNPNDALIPVNAYAIMSKFLERKTWKHLEPNINLTAARKSVNGGTNGLAEVNDLFSKWSSVFAQVL